MSRSAVSRSAVPILFCLILLAGCAASVPRYTAEQFFDTTSVSGASFSHDEKRLLVSTDASGVFNAYCIPVMGGKPVLLTASDTNAVFARSYFPDDDRILYASDRGGNERTHLYVRETDGTMKDLTPGERTRATFKGWAHDLASFYVTTNERNAMAMDLYRYSAKDYRRELVFENTGNWSIGRVSPDNRWLALNRTKSNTDSDVFVVDLTSAGKEPRLVTEHQGDAVNSFVTFTPDSTEVYYRSNEGREFDSVRSVHLHTGQRRVVAEDEWDVRSVRFSWNGRYRVTSVNVDARTEITVLDRRTGRKVAFPNMPARDVTGVTFSRSGRYLAFYVNGDTSPSNLHVMDLSAGRHSRLTDSLGDAIDEAHLVEANVVRYPSFDGREIPALLFKPHDASPRSRAPALVWVHGGPGGQSRRGYRAVLQFLVNQGYGILAVNNRGSSGYGKTFFHLDDRDHGGGDLADCVHGRKYLQTLDWVDGTRVGIIGGSYGGYLVMAALAFEPEAFDVGVDIFGVTNWLRTLKSIPPWWESMRARLYGEMGDPETDEARLRARSPLFHAANIKRPVLVVQGANDPRVLRAESDEMVAAVRENGVPVEYVLFPDEGHGFRRKANRITAAKAYADFLDRYLRGAPRAGERR